MPKDVKFRLTAIDDTERAVRSAQGGLRKLDKAAATVGRAFAGIGAAAGIGLLGRQITESVDAIDKFGKLTDRLGGTTEAFSELQFVAERSGVTFETLTMGLQRMQRRVAEAANGTGEAKDALRELGLSAQQITRLSIDRQFEVIADRLAKVAESGDRTRLAMKLFDSEGVALLQTMTDGAAGIQALREEAERLGVTLSSDQVAAATAANDAITNLDAAMSALGRNITVTVAPALEVFAKGLNRIIEGESELAKIEKRMDAIREKLNARGPKTPRPERRDSLVEEFVKLAEARERLINGSPADPIDELQEIVVTATRRTDTFGRSLAAISKRFQTAEMKAQSLRRIIDTYGESLKPEQVALIEREIVNVMTSGLEEIVVTSKKRLPEAMKEGTDEMTVFADQAARNMQDHFADFLFDPFQDGLDGMLKGFLDTIRRMIANQAASRLFSSLGGIFGGLFGGGSSVGSAVSRGGSVGGGFGIPAFATGGSFTVGGRGGTDANLVAFRATRGENVSISRPGGGGKGGVQIVNNITVDGKEAAQIRAELPAILEQSSQQTIAQIIDLQSRGRMPA